MKEFNPRFTIIVPCYNSEKWIEKCLRSALQQTHNNFEVIFVDNESQDSSVKIAEAVKEEFPELIMASAKNIYPNCWDEARAAGFELSTGDYLLTMGSDDFLDPNFLKKYHEVFAADPDRILALQSPIRGVQRLPSGADHIVGSDICHTYTSIDSFKRVAAKTRCPVNTPTVMFNKKLYLEGLLGTSPEKYGGAADYDLYCNLADNGVFIYPLPNWMGFYYRWHPEQATWKVQQEAINYDKMIQNHWSEKWKI